METVLHRQEFCAGPKPEIFFYFLFKVYGKIQTKQNYRLIDLASPQL